MSISLNLSIYFKIMALKYHAFSYTERIMEEQEQPKLLALENSFQVLLGQWQDDLKAPT